MDCPFCDKKIRERIIIENDFAFAFPTNMPIVPGHILICPKRHIKYYEETNLKEKESIEDLRRKLKNILKNSIGAQGFNYAWNEEKIGGQSVPHFHMHIVPRKDGDSGVYNYEPREFLYRPGPRTNASSDQEINEIVNLLKNSL